jgi:purine-binding chemotaxis protein CheW
MAHTQQFCTFFVESQLFGVEVEEVQEIIRDQPTTRVPLAPSSVAGLINLRGQIVPIIDLRRCLGLAPLHADAQPTHLILTTSSGAVSLRVDEIGDVLDVREDAFEKTPENLRGTARRLVRGVYKLDRGLLLALSPAATIDGATSAGE